MANPMYKGVVNRKPNSNPLKIEPLNPRDSIIADGLCKMNIMIVTGIRDNKHFRIYLTRDLDCR